MKKKILITGSTDGIGKLAAFKLAQQGHHLYLHGRDPKKLEVTISQIRKEASTKTVFGSVADLSNLAEVKSYAEKTAFELHNLDVLINNAGVFKTPRSTNGDNLDLRSTVNYLAPYLLTKALLPNLKKSQHPRIINLSSAAQAPVSLEALIGEEALSFQEAYAQSKLALTMWSFLLSNQEKDISVIAVNPGSLLNTKMVQEAYGHHWSSANKGANILCELAVSEEFEGISGRYFDNDKGDPRGAFSKAHPDAYDLKKIEDLVETTEQLFASLSL